MRRVVSLITLAFVVVPLPGRADATVRVQEYAFAPSAVTVEPGASVTFENVGSLGHTSTSDDGFWNTGTLTAGTSATVTFTSAGAFRYHCAIHASMRGVVIVGLQVSPEGPVAVGTRVTVTFASAPVSGRTYVLERRRGAHPWTTVALDPGATSFSFTPHRAGTLRFRATTAEGGATSGTSPRVLVRVTAY